MPSYCFFVLTILFMVSSSEPHFGSLSAFCIPNHNVLRIETSVPIISLLRSWLKGLQAKSDAHFTCIVLWWKKEVNYLLMASWLHAYVKRNVLYSMFSTPPLSSIFHFPLGIICVQIHKINENMKSSKVQLFYKACYSQISTLKKNPNW